MTETYEILEAPIWDGHDINDVHDTDHYAGLSQMSNLLRKVTAAEVSLFMVEAPQVATQIVYIMNLGRSGMDGRNPGDNGLTVITVANEFEHDFEALAEKEDEIVVVNTTKGDVSDNTLAQLHGFAKTAGTPQLMIIDRLRVKKTEERDSRTNDVTVTIAKELTEPAMRRLVKLVQAPNMHLASLHGNELQLDPASLTAYEPLPLQVMEELRPPVYPNGLWGQIKL